MIFLDSAAFIEKKTLLKEGRKLIVAKKRNPWRKSDKCWQKKIHEMAGLCARPHGARGRSNSGELPDPTTAASADRVRAAWPGKRCERVVMAEAQVGSKPENA